MPSVEGAGFASVIALFVVKVMGSHTTGVLSDSLSRCHCSSGITRVTRGFVSKRVGDGSVETFLASLACGVALASRID